MGKLGPVSLMLALILLVGVGACSDEDAARGEALEPEATDSGVTEPALRQELLEMRDADQAERTGQAVGGPETDRERAERLREIIDEHGWPTPDMVGDEGGSAAWLIAQHADFDIEFQRQVLDLMRSAVAAGDAGPSELAFLEDRVAVNAGQPQTYGSQIRCAEGQALPATPIADQDQVDERRREIGLDPLDEYLAEFEEACAAEAEAT